jgi:CRP/FNR family cyclic AMP-dependent transcriptional regulator
MSASGSAVMLLDADPELASQLPAADRMGARRTLLGRIVSVGRGPWGGTVEFGPGVDRLGLLVLDGFLAREITWGSDALLELVGPGDLIRPWDHDGDYALRAIAVRWRVLEPTRLALLDGAFMSRLAPWPTLTVGLLARIHRRARWLAVRLTISQHPRVTVRLAYLFWHLAERWSEPSGDGIRTPVRLTHEDMGKLVGAQRPSVTAALGRLREDGLLLRLDDGTWRIPTDLPDRIRSHQERS